MGALRELRAQLAAALIALEFITPLRLRSVQTWDDRSFGRALGWYPAVGLLIGLMMLVIDRVLGQVLPTGVVSAVLIAFLAVISAGCTSTVSPIRLTGWRCRATARNASA